MQDQQPPYHTILLRQIKKTLGINYPITPELDALLQRVSDTYDQFDEDRRLVERSLELSSRELMDANRRIEEQVIERTEQLRNDHIRFIASVESLGVGFIMCDNDSNITMINPAAKQFLREAKGGDIPWTPQAISEALGQGFDLPAIIQEILRTGGPIERDNIQLGKRTLHIFFAPILDGFASGESVRLGAVILMEDVTKQKMLDAAREELFSFASHELRTPLTAIRGNASIIKQYFADQIKDPEVLSMINDIHEGAIRLISIVNDFLDASALEHGKMPMQVVPFSIHQPIDDVRHELHAVCEAKGIGLMVTEAVQTMPTVLGDPQRIKQVIYNLVGNALKHTERGTITIDTKADDRFVQILITDTGTGITPEDQERLFSKFHQTIASETNDVAKSTGLGLYISRQIVEQLGGTIGLVHSEPGKGSTFAFSVPRTDRRT